MDIKRLLVKFIVCLIIDIGIATVLAVFASERKRSPVAFFCSSFFVSPIITLVLLWILGEKPAENLSLEEVKAKWNSFKEKRNLLIQIAIIAFIFGCIVFTLSNKKLVLAFVAWECGRFVAIIIPVAITMADEYKKRYNAMCEIKQ